VEVMNRTYRRFFWGLFGPRLDGSPPRSFRRIAVMALFVPPFLLVQIIHWLAFRIDDILFGGYREVPVREPVFIVGVPRSGTTFLHRLLAMDTNRFTTTGLWELVLAPSVTERKILLGLAALDQAIGGPCAWLVRRIERAAFGHLDAIHNVSLFQAEEDYLGLTSIGACFLLVLPFPASKAVWRIAYFDQELTPDERRAVMAFYRANIQRHLYVHGQDKTYLAKNPAFCPVLQDLAEAFPDSRIVCTARTPHEVAPSLLSSMRSGAEIFGHDISDPRFNDRLVAMLQHWYAREIAFIDASGDSRTFVTRLDDLSADARTVVNNLYEQFGLEQTDSFRAALEEASSRSRFYKSDHQYSGEEYGVSPERIRADFAEAFTRFGFDDGSSSALGSHGS
jgi:omega-hydroxy-beta-dihydromenaquinone-9 sulfotransferase